MLRFAILASAFLLSFNAANARNGQNYFGVSAILSGKIDFNSSEFYDNEVNSGFILTYGFEANRNLDMEFSYVRYHDLNFAEGYLESEITAIEVSGLIRAEDDGPFFRLGYSHGEDSASSDTFNIEGDDGDEGGLIYGAGFDVGIGRSAGKLRLEYTIGDYDDGEIKRITIGSFVNF